MYLICQVTLQNHINEDSCNFMSGSSSWNVTILPNLAAKVTLVVKKECF